MKYELEKAKNVEEQCTHVSAQGPCQHKVVDGTDRCPIHGGNKILQKQERTNKRNYQLAKWRNKVERFSDSEHLKSLTEEIGILRLLMEETLEGCKSELELLAQAPVISDLALKIEKLVSSCHKLDKSLGNFLDKGDLIHLGGKIAEIILDFIDDDDRIDMVMARIADVITSLAPSEDK